MTAVDPEGRIRHPLDVFHSTFAPDGSFIAAGMVPVADGAGLVDYLDSSTLGNADAILRYGGAAEWFQNHPTAGSTETIDLANGNVHFLDLSADCTLTFTGAVSSIGGQAVACSFGLLVEQDTSPRTIMWPGSVVWPGGTTPTLTSMSGAIDVFTFITYDGGTTWYGFPTGGSAGSALEVLDEGVSLDTAVTSIDFTGAGVTATNTGHAVTVDVPGYTLTEAAVQAVGHYELLMAAGSSPIEPLATGDGLDWLYVWVIP